MYLSIDEVKQVIEDATKNRKVLRVQYESKEHKGIVERKMAPFDIGTTSVRYVESYKDNLYMFCYDHIDDKTGQPLQRVHPIRIGKIISILETGEHFNENELADIHKRNDPRQYDYRDCKFAFLPNRNWFGR